MEDESYQTTFLVHAKCAAFSLKKIANKQYRNIKASDLVLHYLMYKYCAELAEMLERMNIRWSIQMNTKPWHPKVCGRFSENAIASDFAQYEYSQGNNLVEAIVREVLSRTCAPETIKRLIIDSVVHAPFVLADGSIMVRSGTNPSGHFLTSVQNTIYHEVMIEGISEQYANLHGVKESQNQSR